MQGLPPLMLVSDRRRERSGALQEAITAGAPFVQIREKDLETECVAQIIEGIDTPAGCLLTVNSQPELARTLAVGLHLPAGHTPVSRDGLSLLGRSAHDAEEVRHAIDEGVDYLVVGTLHATASKPGRAALGLTAFSELVALAGEVPVYAIGGLTPERAADARAAGAHGVAVCSAILAAADPATATRRFLEELNP